ncbi:MAG: 1-deoxy-D-xylulose-5-phosphate reductoisomerase [Oceanipulchritudo sp.]
MSEPKRIVLLGATGSIGESTLEVIRRNRSRFQLCGVAANRSATALEEICREFEVTQSSLFKDEGIDGLMRLASLPEADLVIVATTGTIGLRPTIAGLQSGKTVGLANKETLVLGGQFVMPVAQSGPGRLLPVDSEHNAIFQCLQAASGDHTLARILLTASGGPFLHHTGRELEAVTVEEALAHPNWDMGPKVTVDSATMANKGLEMIEAKWLFNLQPDQIEVVIHPQSIIHSMVEFLDGSVIAQMAPPSMTFPIQHVLSYPERIPPARPGLDFSTIQRLELRPPDFEKFPNLRLAAEALRAGDLAPAVYNAANAVAVEAFLQRRISLLQIPEIISRSLGNSRFTMPASVEDLIDLETELTAFARGQLKEIKN